MFFICGIDSGQKELPFHQLEICGRCGSYGRYQVFMTYMCLSLFFIPVFRWNRRYYVRMSCCGAVYALNPETGRRIARGEDVRIAPSDLTLAQEGNGGAAGAWNRGRTRRRCGSCGYVTEEDFTFCPRCGQRMTDGS